MKNDFKQAAAAEIAAFKAEFRLRNPGADADSLTDEDLLREVMNTVGKRGMLGADVRCVVSVAMLTEGWDANTVTHILGIRAFKSQLLCEQVVGRGLRRRSYAVNDEGRFEAEYANVYGVPFMFIGGTPPKDTPPPEPATEVRSVPGRESLRITFPKLDGYRLEVPDEELWLPDEVEPFHIGPGTVPSWTSPPLSSAHRSSSKTRSRRSGPEQSPTSSPSDWSSITSRWARHRRRSRSSPSRALAVPPPGRPVHGVDRPGGPRRGGLAPGPPREVRPVAGKGLRRRVCRDHPSDGNDAGRSLRPILRRHDPHGSTGRPVLHPQDSAPTSADPQRDQPRRARRRRRQHLGAADDGASASTIPSRGLRQERPPRLLDPLHPRGHTHDYVPDFLLRLKRREGEDVRPRAHRRGLRRPEVQALPRLGPVKATTARQSWCTAVNNHGGFGRWGYVEITDPLDIKPASPRPRSPRCMRRPDHR
jgi:type III restriction enzyme